LTEDNKLELFEPGPLSADQRRTRLLKENSSGGAAEEGPNLRAYLRIMQKRRWTILSVLCVTFTVILIATVREKPVYRAEAMLEIEEENPNIITVQQLFQFQNVSDDYLQTQYKILKSDTLARQVIQQLHLDQVQEFNPPGHAWQMKSVRAGGADVTLPVDATHEQAVLTRFGDRLSIEPILRSRLVRVSFDSYDPQLASNVINTVTAAYTQENLEARWEATQKASGWLSEQLDDIKIRLEKSEDKLRQYAEENGLLFLESGKGEGENIVDARLRALQDELTQVQADRYQKESLYRLVESGNYGALPGVFDNKMIQDLTVKLADLERLQAELAPNFNSSYPKMKEIQSQIDRIQQFLKQQREQAVANIASEYFAARRREALIAQAFKDQEKQANIVATRLVQYNILKREVDTNKQLYEGLLLRLKEAGVSAGMKASNIRIVDSAVPPTSPVKPRMLSNLAVALMLGLGFGIGLVFLQERLDNSLKSADDIEHFLRVPALALIPSSQSLLHEKNGHRKSLPSALLGVVGRQKPAPLKKDSPDDWVRVDSERLGPSALSEAFRGLRTSVLLSTAARPPRSLTFVSAEPGEGKTTICSNLAISLAQLGKRVLVIDSDMRRPCIRAFFHVEPRTGLSNYLTGHDNWRELVQPTEFNGLDCLASGPVPRNPSELLSSGRMETLILDAAAHYGFVLLDSPPLLNVADGRILVTMAEGAILVVKGGVTPRELVHRAQLCVTDVGAHLIGVVLNNVDPRHGSYYYSRYYYYSDQSDHDSQEPKP
jgi:capsular exopolysaccharide synthesis family protein